MDTAQRVEHCYIGLIHALQEESAQILPIVKELVNLPITPVHLEKTYIGKTIRSLKKHDGEVSVVATKLVKKWYDIFKIEARELIKLKKPVSDIFGIDVRVPGQRRKRVTKEKDDSKKCIQKVIRIEKTKKHLNLDEKDASKSSQNDGDGSKLLKDTLEKETTDNTDTSQSVEVAKRKIDSEDNKHNKKVKLETEDGVDA